MEPAEEPAPVADESEKAVEEAPPGKAVAETTPEDAVEKTTPEEGTSTVGSEESIHSAAPTTESNTRKQDQEPAGQPRRDPEGETAEGESKQAAAAEAAKEANNPLSNLTSVSFQDYKTLELSQDTEETRGQGISNVLYVRFAKSFGKRVILRASLPLVSTYNEGKSGLGDVNVIVPILLNNDRSPLKFGVGPLANLRTHTDGLGADAWGLGLSATGFYMKNPVFQPGALVTWSYNVAAEGPADEGNTVIAQPFLFFQLGHGTYLRSSASATFEFEHDRYNVPVGLGMGQVLKQGRTVFNAYVEGQQTVWSYGALLPTSQLFFGLNVQILPQG